MSIHESPKQGLGGSSSESQLSQGLPICKYCQRILSGFSVEAEARQLRPLSEFKTDQAFHCALCNYFKPYLRNGFGGNNVIFDNQHHHETDIVLELWKGTPVLPILELRVWGDAGAKSWPVTFRAFTTEDDPLWTEFGGRLIERDGASAATLDRVAKMVQKYVIQRKGGAIPRLPTRVLDVGTAGNSVRLKRGDGHTGEWVALSHCWDLDSTKHFKTTVDNLEGRMSDFMIGNMPRTFQDAVVVTRELGLRYLWIDSLCIVQGLGGDWTAEAPKMGSYYGDAFLTISADSGVGDSTGFLQKRATENFYEYTEDSPPSSNNTLYLDELDHFSFVKDEKLHHLYLKRVSWSGDVSQRNPIKDLPLESRAWTLQERSLSKHILHFGVEQNYLELHEEGKTIYEDGREVYNSIFWTQLYAKNEVLPCRNWYNLVEDYTKRQVSFRSDTLPAISSLAGNIAKASNDVYKAGLWQGDLTHGLLWAVKDYESPPRWRQSSPVPLASDYIAPSWSWASSSRPVRFLLNNLTNTIDIWSRLNGYHPDQAVDDVDSSLFTLIACEVLALLEEYPHGQLKPGGRLEINAPVFKVQEWKRKEDRKDAKPLAAKWSVVLPTTDGPYEVEVLLDSLVDDYTNLEQMTMYAVCIASLLGAEDEQNVTEDIYQVPKCIYGILVAEESQADSKITCRRIGVFEDRLSLRASQPVRWDALWNAVGGEESKMTVNLI